MAVGCCYSYGVYLLYQRKNRQPTDLNELEVSVDDSGVFLKWIERPCGYLMLGPLYNSPWLPVGLLKLDRLVRVGGGYA